MDYSKYYTDGKTEEKKDYSQYYGEEPVDYSKYYTSEEPTVSGKTEQDDTDVRNWLKSFYKGQQNVDDIAITPQIRQRYEAQTSGREQAEIPKLNLLEQAVSTPVTLAGGVVRGVGNEAGLLGKLLNVGAQSPTIPLPGYMARPEFKEGTQRLGEEIYEAGTQMGKDVGPENKDVHDVVTGIGEALPSLAKYAATAPALGLANFATWGGIEEYLDALDRGEDGAVEFLKGAGKGAVMDFILHGAHKFLPKSLLGKMSATGLGFLSGETAIKSLEAGKLVLPTPKEAAKTFTIGAGVAGLTSGRGRRVAEKKGPTTVSLTPKIPEPKVPEVKAKVEEPVKTETDFDRMVREITSTEYGGETKKSDLTIDKEPFKIEPHGIEEASRGELSRTKINIKTGEKRTDAKTGDASIDLKPNEEFTTNNSIGKDGMYHVTIENNNSLPSDIVESKRAALETELNKGRTARVDIPPPPARAGEPTVGGAANIDRFAQPDTPINMRVSPAVFDLPEMVSITKELTSRYPRVKEKMKPGRLGQFSQSTKGIDILSKLSSDQFQSKATLAHEIGHLVDYLSETNPNTLKRGNILGRIASLLGHRANIFPESEQTRQALENMLGRKIDNNYNMAMKKEAKELSFKWRPLGGNTDKKYLEYRNSSKEIYADMISVLLNDPVMLKESAPKFYNNFFGYLDRKPEVKAQYQKILEDMNSGEHKTNLEKRTIAGFERGDKVRSDIAAAGKGRRGFAANVRAAWAQMATYIEPLLHYQRLAKDINPKSSTDTSARDLFERLLYVGSENDFYLRAYNKETAGLAKTHGIDYNTLRLHALLKEVVSPTQPETFTTQGWTKERARESLEKMENRLGSQKFAILEQARKNYFVKVRKEVLLDTPDFKWMVGEKLSNMFLEREHYVTHSVIDHLEKLVGSERGGASGPQIFKRIGSFAEIEDPYSATILKDLSLIRSVRRSRAANGLREWLGKNLPEKVSDKKGGPLSSEISYMRDGKIEKFYVEEPIARMFEKNPLESVGVTRIMGQLAAPFKASFISLNLGFYAVNPTRDYARTIQNVEGMTLTNFAKFWFGAIPESIRAVKNKGNTPNIDRMFKENKITATVHQAWNTAGVESERLLSKYQIPVDRGDGELSKFQKRTGIAFGKKVIGKFYEKLTDVLKVQELTTKLAAEKWLIEKKPGMKSDERGHIIRTQVGTPDTLMRGDIGAFLNSAFLFYNVSMQGWRGNMEAARHHPKEWAWKQVKYSVAPKILMAAAAAGILGDDTKKIMAGFSNYLKQNFHIIPIGLTKGGKSVGLSIPMDETQRVIGGLTDMVVNKLFGNKDGRTLNDAIKFAEQQLLPTPNPMFEITSDILKYFYGEDVIDSFRGGKALSEREKLAGGIRSLGKFTQYEFNKYFSSIKKFNGNSSGEVHTELEKILGVPIIGNPISRYIRVTDYGVSEKLGAAQLEEKKAAARKGLAVDDAIKEKIAAGIKTPGEISNTYREFMRNGIIEKNTTKYQFQKKFKRFVRGETPLERQLVYAVSNNEKVAIINKAKELMGKDELRKLLKDYFEEKLISRDVYDRVR